VDQEVCGWIMRGVSRGWMGVHMRMMNGHGWLDASLDAVLGRYLEVSLLSHWDSE
jgi:hypothetical protein